MITTDDTIEPRDLQHYMTALLVAKVAIPDDITPAAMRALIRALSRLSIPDASAFLQARFAPRTQKGARR